MMLPYRSSVHSRREKLQLLCTFVFLQSLNQGQSCFALLGYEVQVDAACVNNALETMTPLHDQETDRNNTHVSLGPPGTKWHQGGRGEYGGNIKPAMLLRDQLHLSVWLVLLFRAGVVSEFVSGSSSLFISWRHGWHLCTQRRGGERSLAGVRWDWDNETNFRSCFCMFMPSFSGTYKISDTSHRISETLSNYSYTLFFHPSVSSLFSLPNIALSFTPFLSVFCLYLGKAIALPRCRLLASQMQASGMSVAPFIVRLAPIYTVTAFFSCCLFACPSALSIFSHRGAALLGGNQVTDLALWRIFHSVAFK